MPWHHYEDSSGWHTPPSPCIVEDDALGMSSAQIPQPEGIDWPLIPKDRWHLFMIASIGPRSAAGSSDEALWSLTHLPLVPHIYNWLNNIVVCFRFVWWYSCFNVFVSYVYMLYNSTVIGIGLILLFIVLLLYHQCVIRDDQLFWIWIWIVCVSESGQHWLR